MVFFCYIFVQFWVQNQKFVKVLQEKEKKRLQTFFPAILDGLLSRQAKMRFFKDIFQRLKGSKFGSGFQKLLKYS